MIGYHCHEGALRAWMDYPTNRLRLHEYDPGLIFGTDEMLEWLKARTGAPLQMGDALLGAWLGVLHSEIMRRVLLDRAILQELNDGKGVLLLNEELAPRRRCLGPGNWSNEQLWAWISEETGLLHRDVGVLLRTIAEKLRELSGQAAFQPIGWIICCDSPDAFAAHLWDDFLQPVSKKRLEIRKPEYFTPLPDPSPD